MTTRSVIELIDAGEMDALLSALGAGPGVASVSIFSKLADRLEAQTTAS